MFFHLECFLHLGSDTCSTPADRTAKESIMSSPKLLHPKNKPKNLKARKAKGRLCWIADIGKFNTLVIDIWLKIAVVVLACCLGFVKLVHWRKRIGGEAGNPLDFFVRNNISGTVISWGIIFCVQLSLLVLEFFYFCGRSLFPFHFWLTSKCPKFLKAIVP